MSRDREVSAGISQYVSDRECIPAVFRARFSDFQVNEIAIDGLVAQITELKVPELPKNQSISTKVEPSQYDTTLLPLSIWEQLQSMAERLANAPRQLQVDAKSIDKECRTKIYDSVKKIFNSEIVGSTVNDGDEKKIVFTNRMEKSNKKDNRQRWEWKGDFVHFIVYKENCDTMDAAGQIAQRLRLRHINPSYFGYCGTKDRRAKTSQWFSIKKVEPIKIKNACKGMRNITVGNFTFKDYHLKLGHLKGNRFKIALRNVVSDKSTIESAVENLKTNGFLNYYGLQRFGSRVNTPTYLIGKCFLKGDYSEAVKLILEPHGKLTKALQCYRDTNDAEKALSHVIMLSNSIEVKLLQALKKENTSKTQNACLNALNALPRNMRLLYIHAYQSWIWNRCVSERVKRFGFTCQLGDFVLQTQTDLNEDIDMITENNVDVDRKCEDGETVDQEKNKEISIKSLTSEDISSGSYSLFDVVMPLPGFNIEYPMNMKDFYETALQEDGLTLQLKQKLKNYSLGGTYRHIIVKPENLEWRLLQYSDPHCDLILSDMDKLNKKKQFESNPNGKFAALILEFDLRSSIYATMAIRELLHIDTSTEFHSQNNDYYKHEETEKSSLKRNLEDPSIQINKKQCT